KDSRESILAAAEIIHSGDKSEWILAFWKIWNFSDVRNSALSDLEGPIAEALRHLAEEEDFVPRLDGSIWSLSRTPCVAFDGAIPEKFWRALACIATTDMPLPLGEANVVMEPAIARIINDLPS